MTRLERKRPGPMAVWLATCVCAAHVGCMAGPAPTAPADPVLRPAVGSPAVPFVPLCGMSPSFIAEPGELSRWPAFPVSLSIDGESLVLVGEARATYDAAIRDGASVWEFVTGGVVGRFSVGVNMPGAAIEIRTDPPDDDARANLSPARFDGEVRGRTMQRGTIKLFPANIHARGASLATVVGNVVAHEIGHALGILKHSPEPSDLMSASGNVDLVARPWVTSRDLNTLAEAYCR